MGSFRQFPVRETVFTTPYLADDCDDEVLHFVGWGYVLFGGVQCWVQEPVQGYDPVFRLTGRRNRNFFVSEISSNDVPSLYPDLSFAEIN